jgi:hypothetical protein
MNCKWADRRGKRRESGEPKVMEMMIHRELKCQNQDLQIQRLKHGFPAPVMGMTPRERLQPDEEALFFSHTFPHIPETS